jgi:hypothetical protein
MRCTYAVIGAIASERSRSIILGSGAIEFCSRKTSRLLSNWLRVGSIRPSTVIGEAETVPHFNFQRDDPVRALFLSADGLPIGEQGLYWLKLFAGLGVMTSAIALAVWDAVRAAR